MSNQVMKHCPKCAKHTLHVEESCSHILHLLLSVISAGFWIPVWILMALNAKTTGQCTVCGRKRGIFGL